MTNSTIPPVRHSVTVPAGIARAFDIFAAMGAWWPAGYHMTDDEHADVLVEPRAGGRVYERTTDGTECDWGRVLAYDPPHRIVLAWHLNGDWQFDPDAAHASEVEVTFTAEGPDRTRVDLEHRLFERHGDTGTQLHKQVGADTGWPAVLAGYAVAANR